MWQKVTTIANKNNLRETFVPAKSGVNGDRVFISDNYVIKFFEGRKEKYYPNELLVYRQLDDKFRSKLIDNGEINGIKYIVITKSKGKTLYSIWGELTQKEREESVKQIAEILKAITQLEGIQIIDFQAELEKSYQEAIKCIEISQPLMNVIQKFFAENIKHISHTEKGYLTYIDVHFDNFLYDDGVIRAIDFEALKVAPLDYQMDRWCRMSRHPKIYANKLDKERILEVDYLELVTMMKKFYKSALSFKNQRERLQLYSLIYNLNVIRKHNNAGKEMEELLREDMSF